MAPTSAVSRAPTPTVRSLPLRLVKQARETTGLARLSEHTGTERRQRTRPHRIGPWANARGGIVARDVAHLHGDTVELAQIGSNLTQDDGADREGHAGSWSGRYGPGWKADEPARHPDGLDVGGTSRSRPVKIAPATTGRATRRARRRSATSIAPAAATRRGTQRTRARAAASRT